MAIFRAAVPVRLPTQALEHPELAFLDREFDVQHVGEVFFKLRSDCVQGLVTSRASLPACCAGACFCSFFVESLMGLGVRMPATDVLACALTSHSP